MPRAAKGHPKVKIPYSAKVADNGGLFCRKLSRVVPSPKRHRFLCQRDPDEIWLATAEVCSVTDACAPLEKHVSANYTVVVEENFYK